MHLFSHVYQHNNKNDKKIPNKCIRFFYFFIFINQSASLRTVTLTIEFSVGFHETILLPQMQKSHHRSIIASDDRRTPSPILSVSIESRSREGRKNCYTSSQKKVACRAAPGRDGWITDGWWMNDGWVMDGWRMGHRTSGVHECM